MRTPDWQSDDGSIQLHCCDCMELLPTIPEGAVDAVVTDPPYGIGFASQPTKWQRRAGQKPEAWDDNPVDVLPTLLAVAPVQVVWGGNYYQLPPSRGWISWFKPDAPPSMASVEFAWTNQDQNARQIQYSISATNPERVGHPTQKPVAVMRFSLEQVDAGERVFDPYLGSGTTAIACIRTGRRFIGCEIDEGYFNLSVKRIKAELSQPRLFKPEPVKTEQASMFGGEQ